MVVKRRGAKCSCGGDCEKCAPVSAPDIAARHVPSGRFRVVTKPMPSDFGRTFERNFDVQPFTGWSVSTVPGGGWQRDRMFYGPTPSFILPTNNIMYDRSDARTWPTRLTG